MPTTTELRWSATALSTMGTCPEQFRRRYINLERDDTLDAATIIGRALHHGAQLGVEATMAGQRIDWQYMLESAMAHFDGLVEEDKASDSPIPWDEDPGTFEARRADLKELCLLWWKRVPDLWKRYGEPIMAENHFELDLWGHTVVGQIDCATARDVVIDWKTGLSFLTEKRAERNMQKLVYPAAMERITGRYPGLVVFVQLLRKDGTYRLNSQEQLVDPGQKALLHRLLDDHQTQVEAGTFPLNISSSLCSPDWCPYWSSCPASLVKPLSERKER